MRVTDWGLAVQIEWKYILFEWNDSDEEMLEAYAIAADMGVELSFCLTPWAGKSLRFDLRSLDAKLAELMPLAHNRPTRHRSRLDVGLAVTGLPTVNDFIADGSSESRAHTSSTAHALRYLG